MIILYFPEPYDDEVLYSIISRYHYYTCNKNTKKTQKELFGVETIIPTIELASNINNLCKQFINSSIFTEEYFINFHTNLPIYFPFLDVESRLYIKKSMINNNGQGIYAKIGIIAGGVCTKKELYYCPQCVLDDITKTGEAYSHRIHQVPGVMVCPIHECLIKKYAITRNDIGRNKYIRLNPKYIHDNSTYFENKLVHKNLVGIARCAKYILDHDLSRFSRVLIKNRYKYMLNEKKLLTLKGRVRQKKLIKLFNEFYPKELLTLLESNVNNNESNWIRVITRKTTRNVQPIRHILFILFLCKDAETFFAIDNSNVLDNGPWPCLNPAANHYKKFVIDKCKVTSDYKTRQPIATFECSCGFIYSRKINFNESVDLYKIGRIKRYGTVWEKKLLELIQGRKYSLREMSRLMKCDPKTIVKYARKLGVGSVINSNMIIQENKLKSKTIIDYREQYSADFLRLINKHPEYTRSQLRNELKKQYIWFYRNDRNWLNDNLPSIENHKANCCRVSLRVDWAKRDSEIHKNMKKAYISMLNSKKPIRITKSIIGRKLDIAPLLDHYLDKLIKTKKYLKEISETTEDFQIRRVKIICTSMLEKHIGLKKWRILKEAGLKSNCSPRVEEIISKYIQAS